MGDVIAVNMSKVAVLIVLMGCLAVAMAGTNEAGKKFLEENKSKEGVITLPSGMQYKVLRKGEGINHPTVNTPCECHYEGTLIDGTEFDSSYKRGSPTSFAPNQVIKGWTEAMQLMCEGDKWKLHIPFYLAYGERGMPPRIPECATLVFDIEIHQILRSTAGGKSKETARKDFEKNGEARRAWEKEQVEKSKREQESVDAKESSKSDSSVVKNDDD